MAWDLSGENDGVPSFSDFLGSMRVTLHGDRGGLAAADAECRDAALEVLRFKRMQQRHDQPRAGGADGMAERAGAAVDVELLSDDAEVLLRRHRHHGKSLVDFEQ